jgi:5,10-methenyltetrahydromethanopterin hydrogenase
MDPFTVTVPEDKLKMASFWPLLLSLQYSVKLPEIVSVEMVVVSVVVLSEEGVTLVPTISDEQVIVPAPARVVE